MAELKQSNGVHALTGAARVHKMLADGGAKPTARRKGETVDSPHFKLTDLGNAERFAARNRDRLRHVAAWGWLAWDGKRWRRDATGIEVETAKDIARELYLDASKLAASAASGDESAGSLAQAMTKWARASSSANAIAAMVRLARSESTIAANADMFDRDPWAFNALNGTIDLRTGELSPHRQSDMLTMSAPVEYDPNAQCPQWMAFLRQMLPDESVRDYVWRWFGHCLTALFVEQCMAFFIGLGSNGKNVALDVVCHVMGEYAMTAAPDLLISSHNERHPTEIADLDGKRFVVCSEIEQGRQWAESVIKRITGDRTIKARRMGKDFYPFDCTHKVTVAANTKPTVRGTDDGIWRRMRVIEWPVRIPDGSRPGETDQRDKGLTARLIETEASGILAWLVRGCLEWQRRGLEPPDVIKSAIAQYRSEQDIIGLWIEDRCTLDRDTWQADADLYRSYATWCEGEGIDPWARRTWRTRMTERPGIKAGKRGPRSEVRALIGISTRGAS